MSELCRSRTTPHTMLLLVALTLACLSRQATATWDCCAEPEHLASLQPRRRNGTTVALVLPDPEPLSEEQERAVCSTCQLWWQSALVALAATGQMPDAPSFFTVSHEGDASSALERSAQRAAGMIERLTRRAVAQSANLLEEDLRVESAAMICRPPKQFRARRRTIVRKQPWLDAGLSWWRSSPSHKPTGQLLLSMALTACGQVSGWEHLAPPVAASWLQACDPSRAVRVLLLPIGDSSALSVFGALDLASLLLLDVPARIAVTCVPSGSLFEGQTDDFALIEQANAALRMTGIASSAPPPPSNASVAATARVLAVVQNPFRACGSDPSNQEPEQFIWWHTTGVNDLASTVRAALRSARLAAAKNGLGKEWAPPPRVAPTRSMAPMLPFSSPIDVLGGMMSTAARPPGGVEELEPARVVASDRAATLGIATDRQVRWSTVTFEGDAVSLNPGSKALLDDWSRGLVKGWESLSEQGPLTAVNALSTRLPGSPEPGQEGSLGAWALLVCDSISAGCRAFQSVWRELASDVFRSDPTQDVNTQYLRYWKPALAVLDTMDMLVHPLLRVFKVEQAPSIVLLAGSATGADRHKIFAQLQAMDSEQTFGVTLNFILHRIRRSAALTPTAAGELLATRANLASWLATRLRQEAITLGLEMDQHAHKIEPRRDGDAERPPMPSPPMRVFDPFEDEADE
jgi:hypothetical protein